MYDGRDISGRVMAGGAGTGRDGARGRDEDDFSFFAVTGTGSLPFLPLLPLPWGLSLAPNQATFGTGVSQTYLSPAR